MDSAMIAKISKAREYAQEPERVTLVGFEALFSGKHQIYRVVFEGGRWRCECDFYAQRGVCSHTMAMERLVEKSGIAVEQAISVGA